MDLELIMVVLASVLVIGGIVVLAFALFYLLMRADEFSSIHEFDDMLSALGGDR